MSCSGVIWHVNVPYMVPVGHFSTHAVVVAKLITKGKDHGIHHFVVQLRSLEDHTPLPGQC